MKTVLITGASGGIGSVIASHFAQEKYKLLLFYNNNENEIEKLISFLPAKTQYELYKCDLTNVKETNKTLFSCLKNNKVDCLINCAGVSLNQQIQHTTENDFNYVINSNLKSTVFVTKQVASQMISNKTGRIINISSMWGVVGASCESLYSASKAAINTLTLSLAKELGPSNITVNAVCPGLIDTKMNNCYTEETINEIISSTPLNRIGSPSDVANLVCFLASDKASFITGQIITVDGGFTL